MYVDCDIKACSQYHCSTGKTIGVANVENVFYFVFVAYVIQHAKPVRSIILSYLSWLYNAFARYLTHGTIFGKR
jgi:hypothetical protein